MRARDVQVLPPEPGRAQTAGAVRTFLAALEAAGFRLDERIDVGHARLGRETTLTYRHPGGGEVTLTVSGPPPGFSWKDARRAPEEQS